MAVGYMIASLKYADTDIQVCKESAIEEFGLTNVETAIAIEALTNYVSHQLEHD